MEPYCDSNEDLILFNSEVVKTDSDIPIDGMLKLELKLDVVFDT